jgi:PGF-CTERM protein
MRRARTLALTVVVAAALAATPAAAAAVQSGTPSDAAPSGHAGDGATEPIADRPAVTRPAAANVTAASDHDACAPVAGDDQKQNPASDTLGWENGCWYDDPIDVTTDDGLNQTELDAVVARAMARVERVRQLEFERTVPVEVISREEFASDTAERGNVSTAARTHQNVKFEALFMVNETTDAVAVQRSNTAANVLGYYSPGEERIVIVSENTTAPRMDEITLSQELFHALQDQQFNISGYDMSTRELHNARDGIIEGDGNYVDFLYGQRCDGEWSCVTPESRGGGGGGDTHAGIQLVSLIPYSEGPEFVQGVRDEGGWEAVNAVYDRPPASTEQLIHPEKYPDERPVNVTVERTHGDRWHVPDVGAVDHAAFGEGGLFTMFWYASYEETQATQQPSTVVVPYRALFNFVPGTTQLREPDPYSYDHPVTAGWAGDRLVPYATDDDAATNETGYVWKTVWDSGSEAEAFAAGYRDLLAYRGAEQVPDRTDTYRIPDGTEFSDAFYVEVSGDTVTIVNAPTVADLPEIRAGAAPAVTTEPGDTGTAAATTEPDGTQTTTGTATTDAGVTAMTPGSAPQDTDTRALTEPAETSDAGPGFGVVAAVAALAGAALLARRR